MFIFDHSVFYFLKNLFAKRSRQKSVALSFVNRNFLHSNIQELRKKKNSIIFFRLVPRAQIYLFCFEFVFLAVIKIQNTSNYILHNVS